MAQSTSAQSYFLQTPPTLLGSNRYQQDHTLHALLRRLLPADVLAVIDKDLTALADRINNEIEPLCHSANQPHKYPTLQTYDGWGKRIDKITTCEEWKRIHEIAAEEGVISLGYQRALGKYSRVHQYLKLYYFVPVSALVSCPLAMTDGATRLIEQLRVAKAAAQDDFAYPPLLDRAYAHMTSTCGAEFWTSGQWMTERVGGSDIGNSETLAYPLPSPSPAEQLYELHGYKYFTSATTADIAFTLARVVDAERRTVAGSRGLSLFVLQLRPERGELNRLVVHKLKDKLGTKTLPTAELELVGTRAYLVGRVGEGVKTIAHLFNITRIWTTFSSVGTMHYSLSLLRDYSLKRAAFGQPLHQLPAHCAALSTLEVELRGQLHLFLKIALLLGEEECEHSPRAEKLLRLLTPLGKLFSTKETMKFTQEALELFGSPGYMEDTGLPAILRDAQVNTIWEGTSNILSLDTQRAISKDPAGLELFYQDIHARLHALPAAEALAAHVQHVLHALPLLRAYQPASQFEAELNARPFAYRLASMYTASLLIEHAAHTRAAEDEFTVAQWLLLHPLLLTPLPASLSPTLRRLALPSKL